VPPMQKFLSHCAPDDPTTMAPQQMSVALLRAALKARGLKAAGNKAALAAELTAARAAETAGEAAGPPPGATCRAAVVTSGKHHVSSSLCSISWLLWTDAVPVLQLRPRSSRVRGALLPPPLPPARRWRRPRRACQMGR
jgi:hypothetical protein